MKFSFLFVSVLTLAGGLFAQTQTKPAPAKSKATGAKPAAASTPKPTAPKPSESKPANTDPAAPASAATEAGAADASKVVITVGNESITAAEFDRLIETLPENVRAQARGPMKRQMAEQIVRLKLLAAEARKRGLDQDKQVQARIQFQTDNLLAGLAYNKFAEDSSVDEAGLKKLYEEKKNEFETVQARHILIRFKGSPVPQREGQKELSEEEALAKAQEIRKRLTAGEDFAELAKKESDDAGSGAAGGDLGTFGHGQMVGAFDEVAFKLPVGQISEPVKTQFGYHLIRVDKHDSKSFEDVKGQLENQAKPAAAREKVEQLRKEANVTLDEEFFGPATPAPTPGAPGTAPAPAPVPAPVK